MTLFSRYRPTGLLRQRKKTYHRQLIKAWFLYVGKIADDRDFTEIFPIYRTFARGVSQILKERYVICDRGTGAQQFRGLVMSEIHRRKTPTSQRFKFEFSFVENDRRPSKKSGTRQENSNAPDSPDLSQFIPDDRGNIQFRVFICRKNLGRSGNSKIPDRLGFSDIKTPGSMTDRAIACSLRYGVGHII